ncbi:MAG: Holliday junction branch migration protein RuvA, partial [Rhodospirillaceae bacterium]
MIAKLTGIIDSSNQDSMIIDVGGVGYLVFASTRTLNLVATQGGTVSVMIETHVREDHIHLFGFADELEREWFKLLTTVQGVGARVALAMLSVLAPDALTQAVAAQDKAAITQAPGVGPKLATRIITELKDKIGGLALGG